MHNLLEYNGIREPSEIFFLDFLFWFIFAALFFWCGFLTIEMDLTLGFSKIHGA